MADTNPLALAAYHRTQQESYWSPEEREDHEKTLRAMALKAKISRRLEKVV